jgi:hypothetical protein
MYSFTVTVVAQLKAVDGAVFRVSHNGPLRPIETNAADGRLQSV